MHVSPSEAKRQWVVRSPVPWTTAWCRRGEGGRAGRSSFSEGTVGLGVWAGRCFQVRGRADDLHLWLESTTQIPRRAIDALRAQGQAGGVDAGLRAGSSWSHTRHGWPAGCASVVGPSADVWRSLMPWVFWPGDVLKRRQRVWRLLPRRCPASLGGEVTGARGMPPEMRRRSLWC